MANRPANWWRTCWWVGGAWRRLTNPLFAAAVCPDEVTDRYAWFHATAPVEDIKRAARCSPHIRDEAAWLLTHVSKPTRAHVRRLWILNESRRAAIDHGLPTVPSCWPINGNAPSQERRPMAKTPKTRRSAGAQFDPATDTTPAASTTGRAGVDWQAAGRKAYETRIRNKAAKIAARPITDFAEAERILAAAGPLPAKPAPAPVAPPTPATPAASETKPPARATKPGKPETTPTAREAKAAKPATKKRMARAPRNKREAVKAPKRRAR